MVKQNPIHRLLDLIRPHRSGYILSILLAVLGVSSGMIPYFAVARIVNLLLNGETAFSVYLLWCGIALAAFVLKSVFHGVSTRCSHEATFAVLSELRRALAGKLTRVPMGYLTATPSGKLKSTIVERVEQLEVPLAHIIPEMTSNLLVPIAIVIYLFVLDWRMALASLITIPIGCLCYMAQMKEYPKKYGAVVQAGKHMSATTVEYIGGIEVIKACQPERGLIWEIHRCGPPEHGAYFGLDALHPGVFRPDDDYLACCADWRFTHWLRSLHGRVIAVLCVHHNGDFVPGDCRPSGRRCFPYR